MFAFYVLPGAYILGAVSIVMLVFSHLLYQAPAEEEGDPKNESPEDEQLIHRNPSELRDEHDDGNETQVENRDAEGRVYRYRRQLDKISAANMTLGGLFEGLVDFRSVRSVSPSECYATY